ncbi:MAG: GNAT family N-acetyltransferase [Eubacteriaceae bacterium]|nr:GNAT family N-acetyltransferase [Eubacteriaceae bacterium]
MENNLIFRLANESDSKQILAIYNAGKAFLKANGVDQWQTDDFPNAQSIELDLSNGTLYALEDATTGDIASVATLIFGLDPTYAVIYDGAWASSEPYATIHRVAVAQGQNGKGLSQTMLGYCEQVALSKGVSQMRIDTHKDNKAMLRLVEKLGYTERGYIFIADGTKRTAFDKQI